MSRNKQAGIPVRGNTIAAGSEKLKIRALVESGQLQKARKLAIRACKSNRCDAEGWFILGTIHGHMGEFAKAAECCKQAISIQPEIPMLHYNLGIALHRLGKFKDAINSFENACSIKPDFADAFHDQGHSWLASGNAQDAVRCYQKALEINPSHTIAYYSLAQAYLSMDRRAAAISCLENALIQNPGLADAHFYLGNLLAESNRTEDAIGHFRQLIKINPERLEARTNLGNLLLSNDRMAEAITVLEEALQHHPNSAIAHYNLGNAYKASDSYALAEKCYRRALQIEPELGAAQVNLGLVLQEQEKWPAAIACFRKAVSLDPDMAVAYSNLAFALREQGDCVSALAALNKAIDRLPNEAELHWDRSLLWLLKGDFMSGWPEYEWRWTGKGLTPRTLPQPRWDGSDLANKTILVWSEQGIGDELMFASCYPDLIARAGHVVIDCEPRLETLFRRSFPGTTVHGGPQNSDSGRLRGYSHVDYQIPAGSLPLHFRLSAENFPQHEGYLCPDKQEIHRWRSRYENLGPGLKVGISWRGGHISQAKKRSTTLEQWKTVLGRPGTHFINLQYGTGAEILETFKGNTGITIHHWQDSDPLKNLDSFAAQISALDLVISVDNSTVHMAGAVGTPVWLLQQFSPDWRWQEATESSYWYPSVRQFRQPERGDWSSVFIQIIAELDRHYG